MIKFNPLTHTYYDDNNSYKSVTTLLKFYSTSNWEEIKKNYAIKNNLTIDEVTELWKKAAENGTKTHALLESKESGESYESILNRDLNSKEEITSLSLKDNTLLGKYPELIIYSEYYKVAGKVDLPEFYEDRTFTIDDYKTDKEITFVPTAYFDKRLGRKEIRKFLFPINHLADTNWNKYQLQISIYAFILEMYGYTFKGGKIQHVIVERDKKGQFILDDENKPIIKNIDCHEIKYMKTEAEKILKYNIT